MIDPDATGALSPTPAPPGPNLIDVPRRLGSGGERSALHGSDGKRHGPVPLYRIGVRVGLHAQSRVLDHHIGAVGTHTFDARSDRHNPDCALVGLVTTFARRAQAPIRPQMRPTQPLLKSRRP